MTTVYNANITAACTIFCEGPVLHAIQMSGIFPDSKTFVDMPMRFDPDVTLQAFNSLADQNNKTVLEKYLEDYFLPVGSDLDDWVPTDFTNSPPFLETITDADMKQWGSDLNQLWLVLGRQVNASVHQNPQRHSFLTRNYPMIVPGGRFRESYYWDSWWIIRGLLVCDMDNTAKDVINNLLDDLNNFGFIPNGGRIYYLDRSQPPLMSEMLRTYFSYMSENTGITQDLQSFITSAYASIVKEYNFWMSDVNNQMVEVPTGPTNTPTKFNRYYSNYTTPRPESYLVDVENAAASGRPIGEYYQQVRAGAESGWDFSSRWIRPSGDQQYNLTDIHTNEILPVELNSIMYRFEQNLEYFATQLATWATQQGNTAAATAYTSQATLYGTAATTRAAAINSLLWDAQHKHWRDFNLTSQQWTHHTAQDVEYITLSGANKEYLPPTTETTFATAAATTTTPYATIAYWIPMWAGISPTDGTSNDQLVSSLQSSGLLQVAGVLTTNVNTGQQWDSPEAWAPLVMFTIEGLQALNTKNSLSLASSISAEWLNTNYLAFSRTRFMYEKYDAFEVGVGGGGGEYVPQIGFGWTNGVALLLLQQAYAPSGDNSSDKLSGPEVVAIVCITVFVFLAVVSMVYICYFMPVKESTGGSSVSTTKPSVALSERPLSPQGESRSAHSNAV